jgi:hypothetical protein
MKSAVRATLAWLGLLAHHGTACGRCGATAQREIAGQRHLEPTPAHLDDDRLPWDGVFLFDRVTAGEGLDGVVPLRLDPAGVDGEAVVVTDERGIGDDRAVERDDGGQALDVELGQRTT